MKVFETNKMIMAKQALDVYAKQHEAIAKNVANANNPDYSRQKTDFSHVLTNKMESQLKVNDPRHIATTSSRSSEGPDGQGGKVDISEEMGELAVNQIRFDFVSKSLARMYKGLQIAITGRTA